jgi:DNA-binding NtrC family response regulator
MMDNNMKSSSTEDMRTVLVVEDEVLIRLFISAYLRDCGFRVIEAAHADEALVVLQEPGVTVDIVMSDVEMPRSMDGFGLARWLRVNKPGLPVILVGSAARAATAAADLCESGPISAKPYDPQILLDQIRRHLAERIPPSGGQQNSVGVQECSPA